MVSLDIFEKYERAELYRLFAGLFLHEPSDDFILHIKDVFGLKFDEPLDEIRRDFFHLFVLNKDLVPIESIHHQAIENIPVEVETIYHSTGVMLDEELALPPDHLSVELIFVSYLVENDLQDIFRRFFEEHIISWIPQYCERVISSAETGFYRETPALLKEFLEAEYEELAGL
ncbi:MAG: molecular chaperone TorD family protein [Thermodesulfovibrionales bacterium]|nr:molecular chaperone TorD family protein [Thermodesulfovibrionales bacterium]